MLVRMFPEQIVKHWDIISHAIRESVPEIPGETPEKMNNILSGMLMETWECWFNANDKTGKFNGIVVTTVLYDNITETKSLLFYTMYGFGIVDMKGWMKGFKTLIKYARHKGCVRIVAYADIDFSLKFIERVKGSSKYKFLCIPV